MDIKELIGHQYFRPLEKDAINYFAQTITTKGYLVALHYAVSYGIILGKREKRQRRRKTNLNIC